MLRRTQDITVMAQEQGKRAMLSYIAQQLRSSCTVSLTGFR